MAVSGCAAPRSASLEVDLCVNPDGTATEAWAEGTGVAIGVERARAIGRVSRPLSPDADAWLQVVREAVPLVEAQSEELARPFGIAPFDAVVHVGNRASADAFGWVDDHIGINVEAFVDAYGPPADGSVDRMRRIIAHEYVHLLTYAVHPDHREHRDNPLHRALWTAFFEGLGDYVSMSRRWLPAENGTPSDVTARTLAVLEPIFVERLEALATATAAEEHALRRGICTGRFDRKWGSLTVALWLRAEARERDEVDVLRDAIRQHREGVLPLAMKHIRADLRDRVRALASLY